MDTDQLDTLLDASASARPQLAPRDVRAMLADARTVERAPRRRRITVVAGVLSVLLLGGAGTAVASGWLWGDGLENPDRSYSYTSPTWGECEIRFSALDVTDPALQPEIDRIIDGWFSTTDVEAAAAPFVEQHLRQLESDQAASPDAFVDERQADLNAWTAHEQALTEAMRAELRTHGYDSSDGDSAGVLDGAEAHSQVHCEGEDWGVPE